MRWKSRYIFFQLIRKLRQYFVFWDESLRSFLNKIKTGDELFMHEVPFQLFGIQHILTLVISFSFIILLPFYFKDKSSETKKMMGVSLSALIVIHTFDSMLNTFTFNHAWQEAFPLHMCDLSALSIAYYFISREKIFLSEYSKVCIQKMLS